MIPLRLPSAFALAVLSGLLFVPGFPPHGYFVCTLVAFAPLYVAISGQSPRRAALLGGVSLFVSSVIVFRWLVGTLERFGELPAALSWAALLLLSAYHAGRLALATWLTARATARGWPAPAAFIAAMLASELVFPLLFRWYLCTATFRALPLWQVAEFGGPLAVDLVVLLPSVATGVWWVAGRSGQRRPWSVLAVGWAIPLGVWIWGECRITALEVESAGAPVGRIGLVQPNAGLAAEGDVLGLRASTQALAAQGAELVVWPETALHTAYNEVTYQVRVPEQVTHDIGVPTLVTLRLWREADDPSLPRIRHNTVLLVDAAGVPTGRYDKHQLLAFGEYTPLATWFPGLRKLLVHTGSFEPGLGAQTIEFGTHKLAILVCYEDILPEFVRAQVAAIEPDLLVNVTNDAWYGDTDEPWIHLGEARLRAIEHRRELVRATNSGPSGVVRATGALADLTGTFKAVDQVVTVHWLTGRTLFGRLGDAPWWLLTGAIFLAARFRRPGA